MPPLTLAAQLASVAPYPQVQAFAAVIRQVRATSWDLTKLADVELDALEALLEAVRIQP